MGSISRKPSGLSSQQGFHFLNAAAFKPFEAFLVANHNLRKAAHGNAQSGHVSGERADVLAISRRSLKKLGKNILGESNYANL